MQSAMQDFASVYCDMLRLGPRFCIACARPTWVLILFKAAIRVPPKCAPGRAMNTSLEDRPNGRSLALWAQVSSHGEICSA